MEKFLAGDKAVMASTFAVAYDSVLPAWQWFLAHTQGRPVVLVGDSQGSAVLIHLISAEVDHEPSVLRRLLVAVIVGGNLQVPSGKTVGATFTKVPLVHLRHRDGLRHRLFVLPFATAGGFAVRPARPRREPPVRPDGQGRPAGRLRQPSRPKRRHRRPRPLFPHRHPGRAGPDIDSGSRSAVPTPWVTYPDLYSASMQTGWRGHLAPGHQPRRGRATPGPS